MKVLFSLFIVSAGLMAHAPAFADVRDLNLDDGQIADVVIAANRIAIEAGKQAESRSSNQDVKAYAERIAGKHADVNKAASELAARLGLTPRDNPISKELRIDGEEYLARLKTLRGEEFDKAYIDQDVVLHQNVLDAIDNKLMPSATNEELKALLYNLFSPFSEHLADAQRIQESLNSENQFETTR